MNYSVWILLLFTVNAYAQTPEAVIPELVCPVCERRDILQDTIRHESYIIYNTITQQEECEACPTKKQKARRWLERVLFIGSIIAVVIIKVKNE